MSIRLVTTARIKSQLKYLNKIKPGMMLHEENFGQFTEIFTGSFTRKSKCKAFPMFLSFSSVAAIPEQMSSLTNIVQHEFFQF